MDPKRDKPRFMNASVKGAWWMSILEKAFSKYTVFYANIMSGYVVESMNELTNMPIVVTYNDTQTDQEMFDAIHAADK
jgi:hypothetical protein